MKINEEAFILHSCIIECEQLYFIGRVAIDMKIGDILLYENENIKENYVITNIMAYKYELDEISSGMTCKLAVTGNMHDFKENTVLYMIN